MVRGKHRERDHLDRHQHDSAAHALKEAGPDHRPCADFDSARVDYLAAVAATDPGAATIEPPQPWYGIYDARPANARFYLVHQIEEMARHAGHADIIREQLDGVAVPQIELTLAGFAGNDFFQPYVAEPGTIGAGAGAGV